jgi:hypothetical protein
MRYCPPCVKRANASANASGDAHPLKLLRANREGCGMNGDTGRMVYAGALADSSFALCPAAATNRLWHYQAFCTRQAGRQRQDRGRNNEFVTAMLEMHAPLRLATASRGK